MRTSTQKSVVRDPSKMGWIYGLSNKKIPGILKVGRTRNLRARLSQHNSLLGISDDLPEFVQAFAFWSSHHVLLEKAIHLALEDRRIPNTKEMFRVGVGRLKKIAAELEAGLEEEFLASIENPKPLPPRKPVNDWGKAVPYVTEWLRLRYADIDQLSSHPDWKWDRLIDAIKRDCPFEEMGRLMFEVLIPKMWNAVRHDVAHSHLEPGSLTVG